MAAKKEVHAQVGAEVIKEAGKAVAKSVGNPADAALPDDLREINDVIDKAANAAKTVSLVIRKRDSVTSRPQYLDIIHNMNPQTLQQGGVEPLLNEYAGGGMYEVVFKVPGLPDKTALYDIAGPPLDPKPMRDKQAGLGVNPMAMQAMPGGQPGWMAGPAFSSYMGLSGQSMSTSDMMMMMNQSTNTLLAALLPQKGDAESEEVRRLREERNKEREERREEKRQAELQNMQREFREQALEAQRRHEEMIAKLMDGQKGNDTAETIKALAPSVVGALGSAVAGVGAFMQTKSQTDSESRKEMFNVYDKMLQMQLAKPSDEDRLAKQAETMTNFMGNFVQVMGVVANNLMPQESPNEPAWLKMGREVLGGVVQVAEAAFNSGAEMEEEMVAGMPGQVMPHPAMQAAHQGMPPQQLPQPPMPHPDGEQAAAPPQVVIRLDKLDSGMQRIIKTIAQEDGDLHEAAYRLWKHTTANIQAAEEWFENAEAGTVGILVNLRQTGQIDISDERIVAARDAIVELAQFIAESEDEWAAAEQYRQHYDIDMKPPKAWRRAQGEMVGEPGSPGPIGTVEIVEPSASEPEPPVIEVETEPEGVDSQPPDVQDVSPEHAVTPGPQPAGEGESVTSA